MKAANDSIFPNHLGSGLLRKDVEDLIPKFVPKVSKDEGEKYGVDESLRFHLLILPKHGPWEGEEEANSLGDSPVRIEGYGLHD